MAPGDGAATRVSPVADGRAPFLALPSPFCPWEERERRKEEREKRRGKKEKRGRTRRRKQAEKTQGRGEEKRRLSAC